MKTLNLNEAFEYSPATNHGIFYYLSQLEGVTLPWSEMGIDSQLDIYYHMNHSGKKITSPLIDGYLSDDVISESNKEGLAAIIYSLFGKTWDRLWEVYNAEYNPINNYDMTESEHEGKKLDYGRTDTRTDNLTQTDTPGVTVTENESVYGFNSTDPSPSNKRETSPSGHNTVANTGTQANVASGEDSIITNRTLTRSGNIGVTTTQQMISSEISLWLWNYFLNVIIPNIDGVLTISLY